MHEGGRLISQAKLTPNCNVSCYHEMSREVLEFKCRRCVLMSRSTRWMVWINNYSKLNWESDFYEPLNRVELSVFPQSLMNFAMNELQSEQQTKQNFGEDFSMYASWSVISIIFKCWSNKICFEWAIVGIWKPNESALVHGNMFNLSQ